MRAVRSAVLWISFSAAAALATPYVPPEQITVHRGETLFEVPDVDAVYNHFFEFCQISGFEQPLQCEVPGVNFGGEREEESGYYYNVIETDNTLEAIQVWSRYYQLTGDAQFNDEIQDAWIYAYQWPAWLEGAGYYSSHNCAWALAAELQYRTTFGDSSHWNYAVSSANYILQTTLPFTDPLNVMVTGWCCGNLYRYGEATGNPTYMNVAVERARQIINWVAVDPQNRLSLESWAMSSGTFVWGLCNSIFRSDPNLGQQWVATYGPMVQVYEPAQAGWSNAWNVAYCNAQGGMYDVTGDSRYQTNHLRLTQLLLSRDQDNDGGIPASAAGSQYTDASWTTCYLALMGCDRYLGAGIDAGVLLVTSPRNLSRLTVGVPIPVTALVGNWGTQNLTGVLVTVDGALQDSLYVDLPPHQNIAVNFGTWTPAVTGIDSLWVTTHAPGDTTGFNDSDISYFKVRGQFEEDRLSEVPASNANPPQLRLTSNGSLENLRLEVLSSGHARIELFNIRGQKVAGIPERFYSVGEYNLGFPSVSPPSGVYFVVWRSERNLSSQKILILK
jgi:hypothetical protein